MPPIQGWFRSKKPLGTRQRLEYYEDIYGERNPDEDLEGVHILADESDTDPEILGGKGQRRARNKKKPQAHNKSRNDGRDKAMETAGAEGMMPLKTLDRSKVVVTIDDDSDVDELFVADIRRYAQTLVDESDGDDDVASAEPQDQDQIDETFLEEIRRYAQSPENTVGEEDNEIQSSDGPAVIPTTELPVEPPITSSTETLDESAVVQTTDESEVSEEAGSATITEQTKNRVGFQRVLRAHSWDSSQGSDYVYSDGETENDKRNVTRISDRAVEHNEGQSDMIDNDDFPTDDSEEHELMRHQAQDQNETQIEELARTGSESSDDLTGNRTSSQLIDLISPVRSEESEDEILFLESRLFSKSATNQMSDDHDPFMSPKSDINPHRKRHKRFGMFASQPIAANSETVVDLTQEEPPQKQRLGSIMKKRRREQDHTDTPTKAKRNKYNLRPRTGIATFSDRGTSRGVQARRPRSTISQEFANELEDALNAHRRQTRSMSAKKNEFDNELKDALNSHGCQTRSTPAKKNEKVNPRHRAARKTAPAAMGLTIKEDTARKRQTVQVVIPETDIDRSAYRYVASDEQED
ncbi:hypothetical protein VTO58DRAFT_108466 [Aureobasidium pullulans]|nr:hypothetical protein JADG_009787 [Aureobasidium pullulans]